MTRVLITGGTGVLGSELVPRFVNAGYTVRVMSRRGPPPDADPKIEWARASLETGEGHPRPAGQGSTSSPCCT